MKVISCISAFIIVSFLNVAMVDAAPYSFTCPIYTTCEGQTVTCPEECPNFFMQTGPGFTKWCQPNCGALGSTCSPFCRPMDLSCDSPGSACFDPRFIGADGGVFYFHGKSNEHFSLVSDHNLQINSRFIGHRPAGRPRDFTWIQALGILFNSHNFSVEATKAATWDENIDHFKFTFDGRRIIKPEGAFSTWTHQKDTTTIIIIKRTADQNRAIVKIPGLVEILINVVPVTKEDSRIHNYGIPSNDCFAHLEVQFRFYSLSAKVEGVLGRTYQPDYVNPAKPGVVMPVLGGENRYRTTSLLTADCKTCIYSPDEVSGESVPSILSFYSTLDCTGKLSRGNGVACNK
ncbi:OLC1v1017688C1 [Oldenlandia corymbosa var. corymbosa]|uniref:OLC1v1017688C1 n=1 Tax=Oldenlandia corymbosa var. corymbosa TaxID=529605 RepID=A0AAV1EAA7_OLDCO|nr:OLC1v1017688C1 [Oldenlandia corymbosa var. corymbosa]